MLSFFRKKKGYLNWLLWLMIPLLGAGMVLLFVGGPGTGGVAGDYGVHIATVAGEPIPTLAFREAYQNLVQRYRDQFGDQFQQIAGQLRLGDQAVNALITEYAVAHEARRLGMHVTPEEVQAKIVSYPVFRDPSGNFIGVARYEEILRQNNLTIGMFEQSVRRQLLREKLQSLLTDGLTPTDWQIRREFIKQNQQSRVAYVYFDKESAGVGGVEDEQLREFFTSHSEAYKTPERRRISYLSVPLAAGDVEIPEDELQARVETIPEVERVRASHILISVPPSATDDSEARRKAGELLKQIRAGADFAALAKAHSDDEQTAVKGGDLGFFERGMMVPEFEQVAFSQEPGEISDLVKTPFGIHIIKTTAKPRNTMESRRLMAEFQLREEKAGERARAKADALLARWKEGAEITELAAEEGVRSGQTDFFGLNEPLAGTLPVRPDFNQQVFALKQGEFTEPYAGRNAFIVARLDAVQPPRLPKFEEVRDRLAEDYLQQKRGEIARQQAREFFERARVVGLSKAAEEQGLQVTATDFFKSGVNVDDILKFSPVMHDWLTEMEVGDVSPPITVADNLVVFEVVDKTPFDEEAFQREKEDLESRLASQMRNTFFTSYLQNVVDRLRKEEKIQIDRTLLDQLTA